MSCSGGLAKNILQSTFTGTYGEETDSGKDGRITSKSGHRSCLEFDESQMEARDGDRNGRNWLLSHPWCDCLYDPRLRDRRRIISSSSNGNNLYKKRQNSVPITL